MVTPSPEIIQLLSAFAPVFTQPTFARVVLLVCGALLAPGRRTVAAALRAVGLGESPRFTNFHRVFNRNRVPFGRSAFRLAHLLFGLLLRLVSVGEPVVLLGDETLERRRGPQIRYKGWFRAAARSTASHVVTALGVRWFCLCVLVPVPWSSRRWALPFLAVPVRSAKTCAGVGRGHVGSIPWTIWLLRHVRAWCPARELVFVGDGAYAAVPLIAACQSLTPAVRVVTRLRWDAALYDSPEPQSPSKRGPKPKKGVRQPSLQDRVADPATVWTPMTLAWYGGRLKTVEYATGTALWHTQGRDPVPLRWLLVREPEGTVRSAPAGAPLKPMALCSSDPHVTLDQLLAWFVGRWNIEVTFEELRAHLGFETQRQWSPLAIGRETPCLCGLFSLAVLLAQQLYPERLPIRQSAWYEKEEATFSDVLAAVRQHLWGVGNSTRSASDPDSCLIPRQFLAALQQVACYAT